jgi:hypothetical protein
MKIKPRVPGRIRISDFRGYSNEFKNLTEGSEHMVIPPPEEYKEKYPNNPKVGYWVMGVTEPVRVLPGEFEVID